MDTKDLRGLLEAYSEVYAPEQIDEAVKGADPELRRAASAERRGGDKRLSPSKGKGYADHAMQQAAYVDKKTKGKHIPGYAYAEEVEQLDEISDKKVKGMLRKRDAQDVDSGGISGAWMARRRAHQAAARRNVRTGSNVRVDSDLAKEEVDLYDIILSHLLDEGYASTEEAAIKIMANMSEEWKENIMEISMMHVQLAAQPRPAEVRKAPAKKPSPGDFAPAAATAAVGGAAVAGMKKKKSNPGSRPIF